MALFGKKGKQSGPPCPKCQQATVPLGKGSVKRVPDDIECFACIAKSCDAIYQRHPEKGLLWIGTYSRYVTEDWIGKPKS